MKLSRIERWSLSNQYRILAKLYPDEADSYERAADALESGYELEYDRLAQHVYEDELTIEQCRFVYNVMGMYQRLKWAYEDLPAGEKAEINPHLLEFPGFDGNNETEYLGYARYIVSDGRSFQNLNERGDFNSHMPTLGPYQNMLTVWQKLERKQTLTKDDILSVVNVGW